MHSCLTLANIGGHWYVEREISGLLSKLRTYCDSIEASDLSIEGARGQGEARCWRIALNLRVSGENARITAQRPEGADPHQSLSQLLADVFTRAQLHLDHISERHHQCCCRDRHGTIDRQEACA